MTPLTVLLSRLSGDPLPRALSPDARHCIAAFFDWHLKS
jgi:hypothetical protein